MAHGHVDDVPENGESTERKHNQTAPSTKSSGNLRGFEETRLRRSVRPNRPSRRDTRR